MLRILWNSKSGMIAHQEKLDCISNNLVNVNTNGYKKVDSSFSDLVYETLNRKGYPITKNNNRINDPYNGTGVKSNEWIRDNKQGSLKESGLSTDFAIDGEGYFRVTLNDGKNTKAYTRNGNFRINANGELVDMNGNRLDINYNAGFNNNNVEFSQDNFIVLEDGTIMVRNQNDSYNNVGTLSLYTIVGQKSLVSIGNNLYVPAKDENGNILQMTMIPPQDNRYSILQGYEECSNVDMASEMTDMIIAQRAFELNSRGLRTADEMWSMINNLKSR